MRIALSDPRSRGIFLTVVILICAAISYIAGRASLAAAWSTSSHPECWKVATQLEPDNAVYLERLGLDDWWKNRHPLWQKGGLEKSAADRGRQVRAGLSKYLPYFVYAVLTLVVFLVLGAGRLLFSDHTKQAKAYSGVKLMIAVLPFENLSSHPDDRHLAERITEDVISHLGENAEFYVISVEVAGRSGPGALSPEKIARKYHPDALVTGTLMHSGDKIRITTQLFDARTGEKISADELDRSPQAVRSLGNDVARLISNSVRTSRWPHVAAP
jgi:TolB-like protein